jgi:ferrous iron transport protein A
MDILGDNSPPAQGWNLTFVGGTPDREESPSLVQVGRTAERVQGSLPLAMTSVGDRVWVVQIKGGHRMVRRLTDLGIVQGSEITIVGRAKGGSVIVGLQGCRIGVGAGMALRVMVTAAQPEPMSAASAPALSSHSPEDSDLWWVGG